jgi:hypothetical protein
MALSEKSDQQGIAALEGTNTGGGDGVFGSGSRGVHGESITFQGVFGHSVENAGVVGDSDKFDGVFGLAKDPARAGVSGHNQAGGLAGFFEGHVVAFSKNNNDALVGTADGTGRGVVGIAKGAQAGVVGDSAGFDGGFFVARKKDKAGVSGHNTVPGGLAGFFEGTVVATGDITGGGISLKQLRDAIQQHGAVINVLQGQIGELAARLSAGGL